MAFLENLDRFYGTGEKNRAGESLEEFLEHYNPKQYDSPSNTVDIVVVRCQEALTRWGQPLKVLMIKRSNHPSIGCWATPGGFAEMREDLEDSAARELEEETGVKGLPLQQLTTWGNYDRDPRWRVITTSFVALVEGDIPVRAGDDAADALWMDVGLIQESVTEDGRSQIWKLTLKNSERGICLEGRVKVTRSAHPILAQETFTLLESQGIAVDHACIITQALLYLKSRIHFSGWQTHRYLISSFHGTRALQ